MQNKSFRNLSACRKPLKKCINPTGHVKLYIKSFPLSEFISELEARSMGGSSHPIQIGPGWLEGVATGGWWASPAPNQ